MKKLFLILMGVISLSAYAVDYTPVMQANAPMNTMQSVNSNGIMSSGSAFAPSIHEIGAEAPSRAAAGVRKAPPGTGGESSYDPTNPQFSPVGDALIPLLLMAMAYAVYILRRKFRSPR